jgi:hypothetical protein
MNPSHLRWQTKLAVRQQQAQVAAVETDLSTVQGDVSTLQGDVSTAQGDISALETDVPIAQATADEALEVAEGAVATAGQAQVAAGKSPTPYILPISGGTQAEIRLGPGLTADSFQYQINGGGYGGYSGAFSISPGDTVQAYSVTSGLANSDVVTYEN